MAKTTSTTYPLMDDKTYSEYQSLLQRYKIYQNRLYQSVVDQSHMSAGTGGYYNQLQNNFRNVDMFGKRTSTIPTEVTGLTFITRPKLCLASSMLKQDPFLVMFNTTNTWSPAFATRMFLDTKLSKADAYSKLATSCPYFNPESPWLTPVMNNLTSISGFPDPTLDVYTSEGGFFNEDISFVKGSDETRRTFELQLSFNDVRAGMLMALFQVWFQWMALCSKGVVMPYMEDMMSRRLNYTVSIYRFMFDPSRRFITRWCKCTGCFPRATPLGAVFNKSADEAFSASASTFTIPFTCNVFEANKVTIIQDFNILAKRYCPNINVDYKKSEGQEMMNASDANPSPTGSNSNEMVNATTAQGTKANNAQQSASATSSTTTSDNTSPNGFVHDNVTTPEHNYIGLPYIYSSRYGFQMKWRYRPTEDLNYDRDDIEEVTDRLVAINEKITSANTKTVQQVAIRNSAPKLDKDGIYHV